MTEEADWETLSSHLQDAIDHFLIDEVRGEREAAVDLEAAREVYR
jgi:hypothetical protein